MILSILICHLNERKEQIETLTRMLGKQGAGKPVEVLIDGDGGEKSISQKRNDLILRANGEYVAFVDDDDTVADTYIDDILAAVKTSHPDVIGIEGIIKIRGEKFLFRHSIEFQCWYTGSDGVFYRTPNHLNPIRREIALRVGFPPQCSFGEDKIYSDRILKHTKTEQCIDHPIYFYDGAGMGYINTKWIRDQAKI